MRIQIFILILLGFQIIMHAQGEQEPLTAGERMEVVDSIGAILERNYVFPEIGIKIQAHLQTQLSKGLYDQMSDPHAFSDQLTKDVQAINDDRHLRIGFAPEMIAMERNTDSKEDSLAMEERNRRQGQLNNYGFKEVKILEGNIGYLNLSGFFHVSEEAGQTAQAAMNLLSNSDALIIDLRQNGGGSPSMIQLITSYLYGPEPVHLNNFYYRPVDAHTQTWTLPYVPGTRRPDIDVYVLTSGRTFSAAEEFSYNLRNLERATLIGEVTGGGAHPGGTHIASERFTVWVPSGRAINPITKTNWEGTGVQPHVEVPAAEALTVAKMKALEKLMKKADDDQSKFLYKWSIGSLESELNPVHPSTDLLTSYAGKYGPRQIKYKDGQLFYQRDGNPEYRLIPMKEDLFMIKEIPYFRIQMISENGKIIGLKGLYNDGRIDKNMKTDMKP